MRMLLRSIELFALHRVVRDGGGGGVGSHACPGRESNNPVPVPRHELLGILEKIEFVATVIPKKQLFC